LNARVWHDSSFEQAGKCLSNLENVILSALDVFYWRFAGTEG
jgi:hypothetical protein